MNSTHPAYAEAWQRIRDVMAGDHAIKRANVPRLDSQTEDEYRGYVERGFFYNATARTVSGYVGMIFHRDPVFQLLAESAGLHPVLNGFVGTTSIRRELLANFDSKPENVSGRSDVDGDQFTVSVDSES